jgi:hypothetical protein
MDELNNEVRNINRIISEIYGEFKNARKINYNEQGIIKYDASHIDRFGSFKFFKINGEYILKPLSDENSA